MADIVNKTQETLHNLLDNINQQIIEDCPFCGAIRCPTKWDGIRDEVKEWGINHLHNCPIMKITDVEAEIIEILNPTLPEIELKPISKLDEECRILLDRFVENCNDGDFIDYDGYGYYGTLTEKSNRYAWPTNIVKGEINRDFPFVYWYNR